MSVFYGIPEGSDYERWKRQIRSAAQDHLSLEKAQLKRKKEDRELRLYFWGYIAWGFFMAFGLFSILVSK